MKIGEVTNPTFDVMRRAMELQAAPRYELPPTGGIEYWLQMAEAEQKLLDDFKAAYTDLLKGCDGPMTATGAMHLQQAAEKRIHQRLLGEVNSPWVRPEPCRCSGCGAACKDEADPEYHNVGCIHIVETHVDVPFLHKD